MKFFQKKSKSSENRLLVTTHFKKNVLCCPTTHFENTNLDKIYNTFSKNSVSYNTFLLHIWTCPLPHSNLLLPKIRIASYYYAPNDPPLDLLYAPHIVTNMHKINRAPITETKKTIGATPAVHCLVRYESAANSLSEQEKTSINFHLKIYD